MSQGNLIYIARLSPNKPCQIIKELAFDSRMIAATVSMASLLQDVK